MAKSQTKEPNCDVDAVVAEFGRPDGEPAYEREFELRDPDSNWLRIRRLAS